MHNRLRNEKESWNCGITAINIVSLYRSWLYALLGLASFDFDESLRDFDGDVARANFDWFVTNVHT